MWTIFKNNKRAWIIFSKIWESSIIKTRNYLLEYKIKGKKYQPIITIKYNKCLFLLNNSISNAYTWISNLFL